MEPNIVFSHVTKTYKGGVTALEDVSFSVGSGVFGLLGHNGAGKSTLMKALVTVEPPNSGAIQVCGFDTVRQGREVRQRLGYLPQELPMYPSLSVRDFLGYMGELKGVRDKTQVEQVLLQVEMQDFARRKIGQLSGGMRRRVGIAQALLGDPPFLIFDEPTVGLDPEERIHFRNLFSRAAQDRLVLLSTHIIEDVQSVCDRLVVIDHGQILFTGTPEQLIQSAAGHVGVFWEKDETLEQGLHITARVNTSQGIRCRAVADKLPPYAQAEEPSLEDAYLYLISREADQ